MAERQLGSKKMNSFPSAARGNSASVFRSARSRASASSPCEINGRPQQPLGAGATARPAASRTSLPATPTSGL